MHTCYQRDSLLLYSELMTDLHSLKLKDEVLECLYSLSPISPVRDYELSFYFDTTTVQPCKNIADNVDAHGRWSYGLHPGSIGF